MFRQFAIFDNLTGEIQEKAGSTARNPTSLCNQSPAFDGGGNLAWKTSLASKKLDKLRRQAENSKRRTKSEYAYEASRPAFHIFPRILCLPRCFPLLRSRAALLSFTMNMRPRCARNIRGRSFWAKRARRNGSSPHFPGKPSKMQDLPALSP